MDLLDQLWNGSGLAQMTFGQFAMILISLLLLYLAIASKIVFIPLVATVIGHLCGLKNEELGVLYIMMATPTAAAAYPMVRAIGGDHHLTAAIIAGSTLLSMFSTTIGLFLLHFFGWV